MLIRTHLAITMLFILIFFPIVNNKIIFVLIALVSTFFPDIDTRFSFIGKKKILRILQFFTKHRGLIHSFTFLILLILLLLAVYPVLAFSFFLGYGLHLLADSFTIEGIKPFYPFKKKISGLFKTGGKKEIIIFAIFIVADLFLILRLFFGGVIS